jgi:hypothetical protein
MRRSDGHAKELALERLLQELPDDDRLVSREVDHEMPALDGEGSRSLVDAPVEQRVLGGLRHDDPFPTRSALARFLEP